MEKKQQQPQQHHPNSLLLTVLTYGACFLLLGCIITRPFNSSAQAAAAAGSHRRAGLLNKQPAAQPPSNFSYEQYGSLQEALAAHREWQSAVLQQLRASNSSSQRPPVLLIDKFWGGWGNRMPSLVTGMLMAVLTGRVLMLQPSPHTAASQFLQFNWDMDWAKYSTSYNKASSCAVDYNKLAQADLRWCKQNNATQAAATVLTYWSSDYEVPLLQVNPAFKHNLQAMAPAGNIFHQLSKQLFQPTAVVLQAAQPYAKLADKCLVGVQIRTAKKLSKEQDVRSSAVLEQFASITRATAQHLPGTVFVASDAPEALRSMSQLLPERQVWWANLTASAAAVDDRPRRPGSSNPGSDLSAFVDLHLLSRCQAIVLTAGSSFGTMAAGMSNTPPIHAVIGLHDTPYTHTWFWRSTSSEPNMYKLGASQRRQLAQPNLELLKQHPLYFHFSQGHP